MSHQLSKRILLLVLSLLITSVALIESTAGSNVSIVISPADTTVIAQSSVLMVCVARGDPAPAIQWAVDGNDISNCTSNRHTVLEEIVTNDIALNFTESVLEICGIELEESGEYSCTASNGISTATVNNTANLTVIPETSNLAIVVTTPSATVRVGSTVLLVCVAFSERRIPSIKWHFNGTEITNSTLCHDEYTVLEQRISQTSGIVFMESILEICSVDVRNSGEYLCTAMDGINTISATNATVLTILPNEVPSQPENCLTMSVYTNEDTLLSVNFDWSKVDDPEQDFVAHGVNLNVTHYVVSVEGLGTHVLPALNVCSDGTNKCSYSYPVSPSFNLPSRQIIGHVAAESEVGRGGKCSPLESPRQTNPVLDTTIGHSRDGVGIGASTLQLALSMSSIGFFFLGLLIGAVISAFCVRAFCLKKQESSLDLVHRDRDVYTNVDVAMKSACVNEADLDDVSSQYEDVDKYRKDYDFVFDENNAYSANENQMDDTYVND